MATDDDYRLPRHSRPLRYELELTPDLGGARFDGRVAIDVEVVEATDQLVLNAAELTLRAVDLRWPDGSSAPAEVTEIEDNQMVALTFERTLEAQAGYRLSIEFEGILNDQLRGFYRSTFTSGEGGEQVMALTQFEAADARRAFPCWDEPDFKATFQVTLVIDEGLTGLSNEEAVSSRRRADGKTEVRFAETMRMSTYLVAFVVGPYELTAPVDVDGTPVRIAALHGKLGLTDFALGVAEHSLRFLAGYFGIPYPGGKLDHIAVPDFAFGAMENLGCVTYRENLLLSEPGGTAQTELQRIAIVVAHETAHMWFGDLVTMKWWNGIWLNEAFATFMELTTSDDFRPEWQVWTAFGAGKAAALATDGLRATRPVEYPVGRPEEADAMFDVLTYQKGGSVLRMLEQYLGPEVFRKGISHYLATHSYGNTETADLWDALETISGEPVRSIMETWILQGGYPMVSVEQGDDPATVVLRQKRFMYDGSATTERWAVPVNLRASVGGSVLRERLLLSGPEGSYTFSGPIDWVVVNEGAWGFYRSRYSPELWQRLAGADPAEVLTPLERLQLVGDTWAAVVSGQADLSEWVAAATAVAAGPDPDVWGALAEVLFMLDLIGDDDDLAALAHFVRRLAGPAWEAVGWTPRDGEEDRIAIARGRLLSVLAIYGADRELAAQAADRLAGHLSGAAPLPADLIGAVARTTVATGGTAEWEQVHTAFQEASETQEKLRYLHALAETTVPQLRLRTLELCLGPQVRSQDAPFTISIALARRRGSRPSWEFLTENWDRTFKKVPASLLVRIVESVTTFVDPQLAEAARTFLRTTPHGIVAVRLDQILERMEVNGTLANRLRGTLPPALG